MTAGLSPNAYQLNVTIGGGNSTVVGGLLGNFTATGNHTTFIIVDPTLLGLPADSITGRPGGVFTGSGSNDTFMFVGGSTSQFGSVTLAEPTSSTGGTVDFSNFHAGSTGDGINLNLQTAGPQVVSPYLTLTLPPVGVITNVVGTASDDTIIGTGTGTGVLKGAALDNNSNPNAADTPTTLPSVPVQWVLLDFEHTDEAAEHPQLDAAHLF